jgi:ATP-dependent DNA helicase DinG
MSGKQSPLLPHAPTVVVTAVAAVWLTADGELEDLTHDEAAQRLKSGEPPIVCHTPATARRLGSEPFQAFDILELFAFAAPAQFCIPTPRGVAAAVGMDASEAREDEPLLLRQAAQRLLLTITDREFQSDSIAIATSMAQGGWLWGEYVLAALDATFDVSVPSPQTGLEIWKGLEEWSEDAPPPPPGDLTVEAAEARGRLAAMLGDNAEERPSQADYASAATQAFQPRLAEDAPHFLLAEAGTGVGKTKGYIAPASVWAEKNEAPVWISTYTRNLQHQIDQELSSLYPDPAVKREKVVVRKGRENYLCLLNLEEAVRAVAVRQEEAVVLGLMARWAAETRDGDLNGGDFQAWLSDLVGRQRTVGLTDRRGECIYSACPHYSRCFIERSVRRAHHAELVIANHALVMIQAARGQVGGRTPPIRYVFDEGHHVFDAADSAFSAHLSGLEAMELRRWLRGAEGRRRRRSRGLKLRIEDLLESDTAQSTLEDALNAARALPRDGWHQRCAEGKPRGPSEAFLAAVRDQVYARSANAGSPYGLEVECDAPAEEMIAAAAALSSTLAKLERPIKGLVEHLLARLNDEANTLETASRVRLESMARALQYRALDTLQAWRSMLASLVEGTPEQFVDWYSVDRIDGRDIDIGLHRHWIDPTIPFIEAVAKPAHGVIITSATLTDGSGDIEADWQAAEGRTGAQHLTRPAIRAAMPSPFAYELLTRVFVVNDVRRDDKSQVAAAYRELFIASGGGALGLFTAINRLREVHARISSAIDEAGLSLYAQHVDGLNLATLVDIFRAEQNTCLLGTDAMRDGVDIPGPALRLIVFDRVPWPRPTIVHRARRRHFGSRAFDESTTRLKLKQAYGRLVRQGTDRGVFVMLDPMMPSRLAGAFPPGVRITRVGLVEAVAAIREFFSDDGQNKT